MTERLFVYGTLAPGRPNDNVLESIDGTWKKTTVRGNLRAEGWGADISYPGIVLDEEGEEIEGIFSYPRISQIIGTLLMSSKVKTMNG